MNDEDLRDLFAFGAMISKAWMPPDLEDRARDCYRIADAMIEAKYAEPEVGIAAVKNVKPRNNYDLQNTD